MPFALRLRLSLSPCVSCKVKIFSPIVRIAWNVLSSPVPSQSNIPLTFWLYRRIVLDGIVTVEWGLIVSLPIWSGDILWGLSDGVGCDRSSFSVVVTGVIEDPVSICAC